jgi:hypothetical protein
MRKETFTFSQLSHVDFLLLRAGPLQGTNSGSPSYASMRTITILRTDIITIISASKVVLTSNKDQNTTASPSEDSLELKTRAIPENSKYGICFPIYAILIQLYNKRNAFKRVKSLSLGSHINRMTDTIVTSASISQSYSTRIVSTSSNPSISTSSSSKSDIPIPLSILRPFLPL